MERSAEEKAVFRVSLEGRTAQFAVAVFRAIDDLPLTASSRIIAHQLGKSASSIGANYREANRAESLDDFTHKIGIVLKECAETLYWLELLQNLHADNERYQTLARENHELLKIFQTIRRKLHQNRKAKK